MLRLTKRAVWNIYKNIDFYETVVYRDHRIKDQVEILLRIIMKALSIQRRKSESEGGQQIMKKILLVCAAGMSTSLLVSRMKKHAEALNEEIDIIALPVSEAGTAASSADVVLLGPQVRYQKSQVEASAGDTPVQVIDMRDYGTMNGEAVLQKALQLMK